MMKKAREVIAEAFADWAKEQDHAAAEFAGEIFYRLNNAGFVILPKEPDDELITTMESAYFDIPLEGDDSPMFNVYRSVISHAEGEKG